tara:strand:+ start:1090 stop:1449 length:360 start_codon:yes stop_codon:yes gene_type:complete
VPEWKRRGYPLLHFIAIHIFMKKKLAMVSGGCKGSVVMKYKHILKEYKIHQAERIKRCEVLCKALKDTPEPTEQEEQEVYRRVSQRKRELAKEPAPVLNLECMIDYLQTKLEEQREETE